MMLEISLRRTSRWRPWLETARLTTSPDRSAPERARAARLFGFLGALRTVRHGRGDLLESGRGLFDGRRLLFGALCQTVGGAVDLGGGGAHARGRILDARNHLAEFGNRPVEGVAHAGIGFRQGLVDAMVEPLFGHSGNRLAEYFGHRPGFLQHTILRLLDRRFLLVDIHRDREIHVHKHRLSEAADHLAEFIGIDGALGEETCLREMLTDRLLDQMIEDQRIAAYVPLRLEADLRMHLADSADIVGVLCAEVALAIFAQWPTCAFLAPATCWSDEKKRLVSGVLRTI